MVDRADRLLPLLDTGIARLFGEYIKQMGVELQMEQTVREIRHGDDGLAEVEMESGEIPYAPSAYFTHLGARPMLKPCSWNRPA